jgi:hypothetical protein
MWIVALYGIRNVNGIACCSNFQGCQALQDSIVPLFILRPFHIWWSFVCQEPRFIRSVMLLKMNVICTIEDQHTSFQWSQIRKGGESWSWMAMFSYWCSLLRKKSTTHWWPVNFKLACAQLVLLVANFNFFLLFMVWQLTGEVLWVMITIWQSPR